MRIWGSVLGVVLVGLVSAGVRAADRAVVVTTDFGSGSLAVVDLGTHEAATNLLNIHSDAVVRSYNGKVYVVNRQGQDNILVLDPDDLDHPVLQFSTGNGSNPQDIAFLSATRAYVARLASDRVLVVNPATGDSLGSIDLAFVADADGLPEAAHLALFGGRLYVTCQRLDQNTFQPTDRSEVVVVDTETDTVIDQDAEQTGLQGIVLQAKNPFAGQVRVGAKLYLSCVGSTDDMADGGIEVVDLQNNRTDGVVMGEADLGGNVGALAMVSEDRGYVVVSDASFLSSVKAFDLVTGQVSAALPQVSGKAIPDIGVLNGRLCVLDRGTWTTPEASFWIYDTSGNTLLAGPISTGLPPNSVAFIGDGQAEGGEPGGSVPSDPVARSDFSGDGEVGFDDFLLFAQDFGKQSVDPGFNVQIDLDDDGTVGFSDFLLFVGNFGKAVGG